MQLPAETLARNALKSCKIYIVRKQAADIILIQICHKSDTVLLREGAEILSRTISEICNLSVSQGVFPDACKVAKLKPIYKKGKTIVYSNYRHISLPSINSKVTERIVHGQVKKFLSGE